VRRDCGFGSPPFIATITQSPGIAWTKAVGFHILKTRETLEKYAIVRDFRFYQWQELVYSHDVV